MENKAADTDKDDSFSHKPWYKRVALWICGIEGAVSKSAASHVTSSSAAADSLQHLSLQEKRVWRVVCDVTAVILMAIAAFLFAFWA